ncbi:hypothetical protein GQ53DRAFT_56645 [Thozetella sp. PMI_491]|nr:hypothetical protein GQ53DRAFT_56645 [Thozetella sp. PMI_491]
MFCPSALCFRRGTGETHHPGSQPFANICAAARVITASSYWEREISRQGDENLGKSAKRTGGQAGSLKLEKRQSRKRREGQRAADPCLVPAFSAPTGLPESTTSATSPQRVPPLSRCSRRSRSPKRVKRDFARSRAPTRSHSNLLFPDASTKAALVRHAARCSFAFTLAPYHYGATHRHDSRLRGL